MLDRVKDVLCKVFDVEADQVLITTTKQDLEEWDSMKQLELVTALEASFKIKLTMDEMISIDSVQKIVDAINRHKK